MSTAPSSVPPPSFELAPELPEGVERPPARAGPSWKPWTAWVGSSPRSPARSSARSSSASSAPRRARTSPTPLPAVNISATSCRTCLHRRGALFASIAGPPLPGQFGLRPTRFWPAVGTMAPAFIAFYPFTLVWVAILGVGRQRLQAARRAGREGQHVRVAGDGLPRRGRGARGRGVLLPRILLHLAAGLEGHVAGRDHHRPRLRGDPRRSAEAAFLLPLAFFGFALCLLRDRTGSLYPCIALHCMKNSLAFGVSQHWGWETVVLLVTALGSSRSAPSWSARHGPPRPRRPADAPGHGRTACIGTFPRHAHRRGLSASSSSSWPRRAPPPRPRGRCSR